jgi:AcrR family transcriptional regulator
MSGTIETARQRARREITSAILERAGAQLAERGPADLSLRAVARELGMSSSAVYRYFSSRDELLTALIIEAYDDLGRTAEVTAGVDLPPRRRWVETCRSIRRWALEHPKRYSLVFGTPIPGYAAPTDTVEPGTRASRALVSILDDAWRRGALTPVTGDRLPPELTDDLARIADLAAFTGPLPNLVAALAGWSQLFGMISFELFGQTRNFTDHDESLFLATVELVADTIGLQPAAGAESGPTHPPDPTK